MRKDNGFVENIPLRECREGDLIRIPYRVGQRIYGSYALHKVKTLAKGLVQIKYASTWGTDRRPAKVLKIDLPGDLVVERRPPEANKAEVVEGTATVMPADEPAPAETSREVAARRVGVEEFARLAIAAAVEGPIWRDPNA